MSKVWLISLIAIYLIITPQVVLGEETCSEGELNCQTCTAQNCKIENNCYCASTKIPGDIPLEETPQFVFFSMDDSLSQSFIKDSQLIENFFQTQNDKIKDAQGCNVRPNFYVMSDGTDYNMVWLMNQFGEIGLHSVSHTTQDDSTKLHYEIEFTKNKELLEQYAQIPSIKSSRAPFLCMSEHYFDIIQKLGITIDSTLHHGPQDIQNQARYWPYTLDHGFAFRSVCDESNENCPNKKNYPGMWEFHMTDIMNENGQTRFIMDPDISDYRGTLQALKKNFDANYNYNRAPFGLHLHYHWFYFPNDTINEVKVNFVRDFYEFVSTYPKILFTTESRVVEWIKKPVPFNQTLQMDAFKCPKNINTNIQCPNNKAPLQCTYDHDTYDMTICGDACPDSYPSITNKVCGDNVCQRLSGYPLIEDCKCSDCPKCVGPWNGTVRTEVTEDWGAGFCAQFHVSHDKNIENEQFRASTFYLSLRFCKAKITSFWGNIKGRKSFIDNKKGIAKNMADIRQYKGQDTYSFMGACFQVNKGFNLQKHLIAKVDFIDYYPQFSPENFVVPCGNGVCESDEDERSCPYDCSKCSKKGLQPQAGKTGEGEKNDDL